MDNNYENKINPDNPNDILVPDEIRFVRQIKIGSKIMEVLKENFNIEETIIIREKKEIKKDE